MSEPRASESAGRAARWLGGGISPTCFYLVAFLMGTAMALSLFNPHWGPLARVWPHEVLVIHGSVTWGAIQAQATALVLAVALLIVALLLPQGRARGLVAVFSASIGMVTFQASSSQLTTWVLPLAIGLVGGCLLVRREKARRGQGAVLIVALSILAGNLFLPWDSESVSRRGLEPGYHSTATAQMDLMLHPPKELPTEGSGEGDEAAPVRGYVRILLMTLPQTIGLLLLLVGLFGLAGLGGSWARWVAGLALLSLTFGVAGCLYHDGAARILEGGPEPWELGLEFWSRAWKNNGAAWTLPLAGGLAELLRRRVG